MTKMFGTNGVRGVVNQDMNVQKALQIGKAIGAVTPGVTAIATDTRYTCDMLKMAVSAGLMSVGCDVIDLGSLAGLMSVGCDVIDLGSLPTPALQYYVRTHSVVGGVMITASHNPPQFNGIKVIANDGTEASPQQEEAIEAKYDEEIAPVSWKDTGHTSRYVGAADDYVDAIVSKLDVEAIREANLTVVLDCTNGAAFYTSPLLLRRLGVRAITLNGNPQGEFPGHPSEPTEDNLQDLIKMVKATGAALGIAHDGDADRCVFVDGEGNYVPGDKTLAILARSIVKENGGGIVVTPVATIFADHQFCRDGGMAIGRMLESIIKIGPLKEQVDSLVPFYTVKKKLVCPDDLKEPVLNFLDENTANIRKDTTDGLKLIFTNGWVLARASGTEPIFRVYAESRDKAVAEELASKYEAMVDEYLSSF